MSAVALSVAAFLPTRLLTHFRHIFAEEPDLLVAESWEELESFIRRKPVSAVILDPSADGTLNVAAVAGLLKRYPSLPLIAYVTLHAPAFKAIAQLGKLGLEDVVLHRFDDAPDRFRERVEQVQGNSLTHRLIEELNGALRQLPRLLFVTVENLFEQPHRYASALDLAAEGIAIVSVYRNLDAAGLGSPKRLLVAAKVLRGYSYLRDPGYSVLDVSIKLGYKTARIFSHHWVAVFGQTPARVRNRLSEDEAIAAVLRWIRAPDDDADLPEDSGHSLVQVSRRHRRRRPEHG
jgi:AraC-like DNA-binding protein